MCKKKIPGDETFACVDFQELSNKIKVGDHIIVDFGSVCMKVIDFEDEADFLATKQLEGLDVRFIVLIHADKSINKTDKANEIFTKFLRNKAKKS